MGDDEEEDEEEFDWQVEQEVYKECSEEELRALQTYGFGNQRSGVFARLQVRLQKLITSSSVKASHLLLMESDRVAEWNFLNETSKVKMTGRDLICWDCTDRRNWAMWLMSRTQRERRQQRGGRHGWTQRRLLFLLTITCEFIKVETLRLPQMFLCRLLSANINMSLQGRFLRGRWDNGAAEV